MTQAQRREVINAALAQIIVAVKGDDNTIFVDQMPGRVVIRLGDTNENEGGGAGGIPGDQIQTWLRIDSSEGTGVVDDRGNDAQWLYTVTEVRKVGAGYGAASFEEVTGGYAGPARNSCEVGNTGIGVADINVDLDGPLFVDNAPLLMMKPIIGHVMNWRRIVNVDEEVEVWFDRPNSIDGHCQTSSSSSS
jgi:hypothetical protein